MIKYLFVRRDDLARPDREKPIGEITLLHLRADAYYEAERCPVVIFLEDKRFSVLKNRYGNRSVYSTDDLLNFINGRGSATPD